MWRADLVRFPGSFGVCCFVGGCWVALRWWLGVRSVIDDVSDRPPFVCNGYGFFIGQRHSRDFRLGLLFCCLPNFRAFTPAYSAQVGPALQEYPATCEPCLDLEIAEKYFNVVTDTLGAPSGADGGYQESDIIRASAADIRSCDMILLYMIAPQADSVAVYEDEEQAVLSHYTAPSIQYEPYVATTARETSISGDKIVETFNDGYTMQTRETKENRSYKGQAANDLLPSMTAGYNTLQYVKGLSTDTPLVVLMQQGIERQGGGTGAMVWSEVEPYADAILNGFVYVKDEAFLMVASGQVEPNGLFPSNSPPLWRLSTPRRAKICPGIWSAMWMPTVMPMTLPSA